MIDKKLKKFIRKLSDQLPYSEVSTDNYVNSYFKAAKHLNELKQEASNLRMEFEEYEAGALGGVIFLGDKLDEITITDPYDSSEEELYSTAEDIAQDIAEREGWTVTKIEQSSKFTIKSGKAVEYTFEVYGFDKKGGER